MNDTKELHLPAAVAAYFDADLGNGDAVARCFTADGQVTDEGRTYTGRSAIAAWKDAASAQFSYVTKPVSLEETNGGCVVTGRVTGDFPGSPTDLRYAFTLAQGGIASLEITQ